MHLKSRSALDLMLPRLGFDSSPALGLVKAGVVPIESPLETGEQSDPNADSGWDWTANQEYDLFAATPFGSPQKYSSIRLPYFAAEGPAADDFNNDAPNVRDIRPEDGWVLVYRDFGTPQRGAVPPRFILYNRFRGLLRLFYFNAYLAEAYTYGIVTLKRQASSEPFGLLTFTDETNATLDDYDPAREDVAIGTLAPLVWNYADYLVVGYEPELPAGSTLTFTIYGVRKSDVKLTGDLDLDVLLNQGAPIAKKSSTEQLFEFLGTLFKNAEALGKAISNAFGDSKHGGSKAKLGGVDANGRPRNELIALSDTAVGTDVKRALEQALATSGGTTVAFDVGSIVKIVSAGIALYKFILAAHPAQKHAAGGLTTSTVVPLNVSGTITLPVVLGTFLLRVPGASHTSTTFRPLYDKPLGVFNLESAPRIDITIERQRTTCTSPADPSSLLSLSPQWTHLGARRPASDLQRDILGRWDPDRDVLPPPPVNTFDLDLPKRYKHQLRPLQIVFNPEAGFTAEVDVAYVRPGGMIDLAEPDGADGYTSSSNPASVVEEAKQVGSSCMVSPGLIKRNVSVRVRITPTGAGSEFTPITLVKLYPAISSTDGTGGGRFPILEDFIYEAQYAAFV